MRASNLYKRSGCLQLLVNAATTTGLLTPTLAYPSADRFADGVNEPVVKPRQVLPKGLHSAVALIAVDRLKAPG